MSSLKDNLLNTKARIVSIRDNLVQTLKDKNVTVDENSTLSVVANAVSNIVVDNGGIDTSDGNAEEYDIVKDKIAYANNKRIVGKLEESVVNVNGKLITISKGYIKSDLEKSVSDGSVSIKNNVITVKEGYVENDEIIVGNALQGTTITPSTENQTIFAKSYLVDNIIVEGDKNLTSENIVKGKSIFGVSGEAQIGFNTSDASVVTSSDVSSGLVFYNAQGKQIGELEDAKITVDKDTVVVPTGRIREQQIITVQQGNIEINEETNKIVVTEGWVNEKIIDLPQTDKGSEIVLGQVDANGNFQALAFSGTEASNSGDPETVEEYYTYNGVLPVPESGGGGGSADYYKCASVDTENKTWTGYKAVLTDGVYSFEDAVTTGLTYIDIIPEIGGIYTDGTNVCIAFLNTGFPDGYVFFNSLSSFDGWDVRGATIVEDDNRSVFQTVNDYEAQSAVITTNPGVPLGNNPFSLSFWFKRTSENGSCWCGIGYGTSGSSSRVAWGLINDYPGVTYWAHDYFQSEFSRITDTNWHHVVVTYDGGVTKNYIDGSLIWEWQTGKVYIDWEYINIGDPWESYQSNGRYADYYIYPRVLQPYEIAQLLKARTV